MLPTSGFLSQQLVDRQPERRRDLLDVIQANISLGPLDARAQEKVTAGKGDRFIYFNGVLNANSLCVPENKSVTFITPFLPWKR